MAAKTLRVGFIGAGKVGCSLGKYITERIVAQTAPADALSLHDAYAQTTPADKSLASARATYSDDTPAQTASAICLSGYVSRSLSSAKSAATFTGSHAFTSFESLLYASDLIFVTVPDDVIADVWNALYGLEGARGKTFCHCSGSQPSTIFGDAQNIDARVCSLHPLFAISDRETAWKQLSESCFSFDGDETAYAALAPLFTLMGNRVGRVDPDKKALYHAACVFFSNFAVGLAACGEELFQACGLDRKFAATAWHALFRGNSENILQKGVTDALTGPAERGDLKTIQKHIDALETYAQSCDPVNWKERQENRISASSDRPFENSQGSNLAVNADLVYRELTKVLLVIAERKRT